MDSKAIELLRTVLKTKEEYRISRELKTTFQREKRFLTHLVGSLSVRRLNAFRLANAVHDTLKPKGPFPIIPTHDRCECGGVLVWVNTNSLDSLECYERLVESFDRICASIEIPCVRDSEKIKDYELCVTTITGN